MKAIKIAQIGTSAYSHGNSIWKTMLDNPLFFDVVGYAFPEGEREKFPTQAKAFDGYREMTVEEILNDPEIEAVAVETEEIYLTKYATMVADAGKHLHMEKPGGTDLADFERLVAKLKEKNLVFSIGYMYRFNPEIRKALEKIKKGELGRIYSVEAQMSCLHKKELKEWLSDFPGGMMFFLGCHLVDLIYTIQGEPREVIALNTSSGIDGVRSETYGMAVFKYDGGVSFAKTSADEHGGYLRRQLVISGERGTIEIKPLEYSDAGGMYTVMNENYRQETFQSEWSKSVSEPYDRYDSMMCNFAQIIRGKENPYTYDYELSLYKLILRSCGEKV